MIPTLIKSISGGSIIGEIIEDLILDASFLSRCLDIKEITCEDIVNFQQNGIPQNVKMKYYHKLNLLETDILYPCNPNVVFVSYKITDKAKGAIWYKDEKKLLNHNDPIILEMIKEKDFYALWDYLEDKNHA